MPSNPITFDPTVCTLSNMGEKMHFHWGLFLATDSRNGTVFHLVNHRDTNFEWKFATKPNRNMSSSVTLLLASKIAVMDPVLHQPLEDTLASVPIVSSLRYGPISCRSWVKEALETLDDSGFIKLTQNVDIIEETLVRRAEARRVVDSKATEKNPGSVA